MRSFAIATGMLFCLVIGFVVSSYANTLRPSGSESYDIQLEGEKFRVGPDERYDLTVLRYKTPTGWLVEQLVVTGRNGDFYHVFHVPDPTHSWDQTNQDVIETEDDDISMFASKISTGWVLFGNHDGVAGAFIPDPEHKCFDVN